MHFFAWLSENTTDLKVNCFCFSKVILSLQFSWQIAVELTASRSPVAFFTQGSPPARREVGASAMQLGKRAGQGRDWREAHCSSQSCGRVNQDG